MFDRMLKLAKEQDAEQLNLYLMEQKIIGLPCCDPLNHPDGLSLIKNEFGYNLIEVLSYDEDNNRDTLAFLLNNYPTYFSPQQQLFMGLDIDSISYSELTLKQRAHQFALGGNDTTSLLCKYPDLSVIVKQASEERKELVLKYQLDYLINNLLNNLSLNDSDKSNFLISIQTEKKNFLAAWRDNQQKNTLEDFAFTCSQCIFDFAINKVSLINTDGVKRKEFATALAALKAKTIGDYIAKKISINDVAVIAKAIDSLVFNITAIADVDKNSATNLDPKLPIITFMNTTKKFRSFDWKILLGAVVGAAIGIIIGACVGMLAGPAAALTSLAGGTYGAMWGASLFGASFAALGVLGAYKASDDVYRNIEATAQRCLNK